MVDLLLGAGLDATSVHEKGLQGTPDRQLAVVCRDETRALITLDLDFADMRAYPPPVYHGIIVIRVKKHSKRRLIDITTKLIPLLKSRPTKGRLWIVEAHRVRIR